MSAKTQFIENFNKNLKTIFKLVQNPKQFKYHSKSARTTISISKEIVKKLKLFITNNDLANLETSVAILYDIYENLYINARENQMTIAESLTKFKGA